jgi:hypothetical protein
VVVAGVVVGTAAGAGATAGAATEGTAAMPVHCAALDGSTMAAPT